MKVHIVGGGVAGLTLAATLDPGRFDVVLHDDRRLPDVGTTFGIWPSAMSRLEQIGLATAVADRGIRCSSGEIRGTDGRLLLRLPPAEVRLIRRPDLLRLVGDAVPSSVERRHGHVRGIGDLEQDGDALVVVADGVRSAIRADVWGCIAYRDSGVTALRGVIDEDLSRERLCEYWGPGAHFGTTPDPAGGTNWFATFRHRRFDDHVEALAFASQHFAAFPDQVRAVLQRASAEHTLVNDIQVSRPVRRLRRGNVVLVGDAGHGMAPNLGRGACEAVVDAVVLGTELNRVPVRRALATYERSRLVPPQLLGVMSTVVQRMSLAQRGTTARDALLCMVSSRAPLATGDARRTSS